MIAYCIFEHFPHEEHHLFLIYTRMKRAHDTCKKLNEKYEGGIWYSVETFPINPDIDFLFTNTNPVKPL